MYIRALPCGGRFFSLSTERGRTEVVAELVLKYVSQSIPKPTSRFNAGPEAGGNAVEPEKGGNVFYTFFGLFGGFRA